MWHSGSSSRLVPGFYSEELEYPNRPEGQILTGSQLLRIPLPTFPRKPLVPPRTRTTKRDKSTDPNFWDRGQRDLPARQTVRRRSTVGHKHPPVVTRLPLLICFDIQIVLLTPRTTLRKADEPARPSLLCQLQTQKTIRCNPKAGHRHVLRERPGPPPKNRASR